jgi:predicted nuclease with RNAse H fold
VTQRFAGIDVGARELHCAVVDAAGRILDCTTLPAGDHSMLLDACDGVTVVAIDAPRAPSTMPHADSTDLAPKFRAARCAEIELGRSHGSWVSWVAPSCPPFPGWMETGFAVFETLRRGDRAELLEVYPHAAFRDLTRGRRLPRKQTPAGRRERAELLARAGLRQAPDPPPPSHDILDALAAALVALDRFRGRARRVSCGHDDSAIWLPGPLA